MRNSNTQEDTDVKIIPANDLSRMKVVPLQQAIKNFNDFVTIPKVVEKCYVRIYDYPFFNLHLDDDSLSEIQRQLKKLILDAGYSIKGERSIPPCIMVSWPLP